jgi:hypothetical protein
LLLRPLQKLLLAALLSKACAKSKCLFVAQVPDGKQPFARFKLLA